VVLATFSKNGQDILKSFGLRLIGTRIVMEALPVQKRQITPSQDRNAIPQE